MSLAKRAAAVEAIRFVRPDEPLGVGTGSTVAQFLKVLGERRIIPAQAVSTSDSTDRLLAGLGVSIVPLQRVPKPLYLYVDGADEIDGHGRAIKGAGGALTREKEVAKASAVWVCIVDESKVVRRLGQRSKVPLDVRKVALDDLLTSLRSLGATGLVRDGWEEQPDRCIIDVAGLDLSDPAAMETELESWPGVVSCGIFARRRADIVIVGHADGSASHIRTDGSQAPTLRR